MVGLHVVKNKALLEHIQSCLNGIYSSEEFVKRIKPRDCFYTVSAGESGIGRVAGPFWLDSVASNTDGLLCYKTTPSSLGEFVNDLFYGAKACFTSKEEANSYREKLLLFSNGLYGTI